MSNGKERGNTIHAYEDTISSILVNPIFNFIVTASRDISIRKWDVYLGTELNPPITGHLHWVNSIAASNDGVRVFWVSRDNTIHVSNVETGSTISMPLVEHSASIIDIGWIIY